MEDPGQGHSYFAWDGWACTQEEHRGGLETWKRASVEDQELIQLHGVRNPAKIGTRHSGISHMSRFKL